MVKTFRSLAGLLLLALAPNCPAQAITVRVVNVDNRRPLEKQRVSVVLMYFKPESVPLKQNLNLSFETDLNGEAHFGLPTPAPKHLSVLVSLTSEHWHCGCWVMVTTETLVKEGVVGTVPAKSKNAAAHLNAVPREILILARPFSLFERLLYPFVKE
jgi:hypothetical protein